MLSKSVNWSRPLEGRQPPPILRGQQDLGRSELKVLHEGCLRKEAFVELSSTKVGRQLKEQRRSVEIFTCCGRRPQEGAWSWPSAFEALFLHLRSNRIASDCREQFIHCLHEKLTVELAVRSDVPKFLQVMAHHLPLSIPYPSLLYIV